MELLYKPYIAKVAYFTVDNVDEFEIIKEFLEEQAETFSYRELCDGEGCYLEVEKPVLEETNIPNIGDIEELDIDIIQIWL